VARAWKGHNLSSQVLDFAARQVLERGKKFLRLDTDATRPALCNLYERYGFTRVGRRLIKDFDYALYELEVRA
jgi:ribosomal protein S18 acetylase RimI-like enzyme